MIAAKENAAALGGQRRGKVPSRAEDCATDYSKGQRRNHLEILNRLDGLKQTGPDQWVARCPSHDDRSPSLSVKDVGDRVLIHCFAGCGAATVLDAVGLELGDLFDGPLNVGPVPRKDRIRVDYKATLRAIRFDLIKFGIVLSEIEKTHPLPDTTKQIIAEISSHMMTAAEVTR